MQNLASIQKRTSPVKFAHLAEKSEKSSISNLSTKVRGRDTAFLAHCFRQGLVKKPEGVGPIKPHVDTVSAVAKRLQMTRGVVPVNMAVKT